MLLASGVTGKDNASMAEIVQVRVSREGKELGGYPVPAVLSLLKEDIKRGRSTKGSASKNDVGKIVLWKNGTPKAK